MIKEARSTGHSPSKQNTSILIISCSAVGIKFGVYVSRGSNSNSFLQGIRPFGCGCLFVDVFENVNIYNLILRAQTNRRVLRIWRWDKGWFEWGGHALKASYGVGI